MLGKKALGAAAAQESLFIEDVFSTWLRTGTGADVTVTNNVDMTEGYMLWTKGRSGTTDHAVYDSARGVTKDLVTNSTAAETTQSTGLKAVSSTGYTIGSLAKMNTSSATYVDWVFRKAPKFFDVVTYTGNGVAGRTVAHNLGSVPGMIIVKAVNIQSAWTVYHRSVGATGALFLQTSGAVNTNSAYWNNTAPTATTFTVGTFGGVNQSGQLFVAYLFAHDAGGFGDAGDQSVVSCGSFTTDSGGNATVNLGWEPQWILQKDSSGTNGGNWRIVDNMREMSQTGEARLYANLSNAEGSFLDTHKVSATGFTTNGEYTNTTFIYLAIRRGPMKKPTSGTQVFDCDLQLGNGFVTTNFVTDMVLSNRPSAVANKFVGTRLIGGSLLKTSASDAEIVGTFIDFASNIGTFDLNWSSAANSIYWSFRRAPGFFDVVCYTGTGLAGLTISHNLGAAPGLIITKRRNSTSNWAALVPNYANNLFDQGKLEDVQAFDRNLSYGTGQLNSTPTANSFAVTAAANINTSGGTYVAYLFATLPGVSKVGSYTGTGTTQQINCGFTTGARFVLIKRVDSTGGWYTYDTARGISTSNDPYLLLNSTAAEVTNTDYIDPLASGFEISSTAPAEINASGGTFIYLAIA